MSRHRSQLMTTIKWHPDTKRILEAVRARQDRETAETTKSNQK